MQQNNILWKTDPYYPPLLRQSLKAPLRLFYAGQKPDPADRYFAIVGTRHMTQYGKSLAEEFAYSLACAGFTIVSGLAYGIDTVAHKAALRAGKKTIAVLGAGLNNITPTCNLNLAKKIMETGTILTEYEADSPPYKGTFPARNRIIAGMAMATLIIEAPLRSGALITAREALDASREVYAIPGNISHSASRGCNELIRDSKAQLVTSVDDIFNALEIKKGYERAKIPDEKSTKKEQHMLTENESKILKILKKSPSSIDNLTELAEISVPQTNVALSLLELKGLISVCGSYAFATR